MGVKGIEVTKAFQEWWQVLSDLVYNVSQASAPFRAVLCDFSYYNETRSIGTIMEVEGRCYAV